MRQMVATQNPSLDLSCWMLHPGPTVQLLLLPELVWPSAVEKPVISMVGAGSVAAVFLECRRQSVME